MPIKSAKFFLLCLFLLLTSTVLGQTPSPTPSAVLTDQVVQLKTKLEEVHGLGWRGGSDVLPIGGCLGIPWLD